MRMAAPRRTLGHPGRVISTSTGCGRNRTAADELAASRTRIVHAEEAGRRRIEREIPDAVQKELVALIAKVRLARKKLARRAAAR
jgi:signal transduction histidine kinase